MASAGRIWRSVAAAAGAAAIACLDNNPKFVEPTAGAGSGSTESAATDATTTMTTAGPTSGPTTSSTTIPPTSGPTSETDFTTGGPTTTTSTTQPPQGCGDGAVDPGEECDDGAANADDAACTSFCKQATCGDGLVLANVEECDDGPANADDAPCRSDCTAAVCGDGVTALGLEECDAGADNADDGPCTSQCKQAVCGDGLIYVELEECDDGNGSHVDGCVLCQIPSSCAEILAIVADPNQLNSERHEIDPDGPGPTPEIPVWCDMETEGGGWTLVERSPRVNSVAEPLFKDVMINIGMPEADRYRMPKMVISLLIGQSTELRFDCGGQDYLLTDPPSLFVGEIGPMDCNNYGTIKYQAAQFKGLKVVDTHICTGMTGKLQGCDGAWRIDEAVQAPCGLPPLPWGDMLAVEGADLFAVDAAQVDPGHDCHQPMSKREVKMR